MELGEDGANTPQRALSPCGWFLQQTDPLSPLYRLPTDQLVERLGGPTTQLRVPAQCPNFFRLIAPHQNLANVNGHRLLNFLSSQPLFPSTTSIFRCSGSHLIQHHGRTHPRQATGHVCCSVSLPLFLFSPRSPSSSSFGRCLCPLRLLTTPPSSSTPQNTPLNNAPISSHAQQPGVASIKEGELTP